MGVETVKAMAIRTALSGPAAGVIAAARIASAAGYDNVITCDMGGTSLDVSLVADGKSSLSAQTQIDFGMVIRTPMIEISTIGAGGGSVAHIDSSGLPEVGPESAGADPGPVAYGFGNDRPTVTDANLVLGRINLNRRSAASWPGWISKRQERPLTGKSAYRLVLKQWRRPRRSSASQTPGWQARAAMMLDDLDLRDMAGRATSVVDDLEAQFQHTNAHGIRISGQMHTISVDAGRNAGVLTTPEFLCARFEEAYTATYGRLLKDLSVRAVNLRVIIMGNGLNPIYPASRHLHMPPWISAPPALATSGMMGNPTSPQSMSGLHYRTEQRSWARRWPNSRMRRYSSIRV